MKKGLRSKIVLLTVTTMIFSVFQTGVKNVYAKESSSFETNVSYYNNDVELDNVTKLADLEEKLYRCALSDNIFYLFDYVPDQDFDQFIEDNSIELSYGSSLEGLTDQKDIYAMKRYYLCVWMIDRVKSTKCFFGYNYLTINCKYGESHYSHIQFSTNSKNEVDEKVDYVVKNFKEKYIKDDYTDYEKEAAVVSYLINNCVYDYELYYDREHTSMDGFFAHGALVNNKAVCSGYAEACQLLFDSIGIECHTISSSELNHAWNVVKIDGKYYQLDVTWIDCNNISDFSFFNFSNEDKLHYADDINGMEWYNKCNNIDPKAGYVRDYSITLNKVLKADEDEKCYLEDLYGENRQEINLSCRNIVQGWMDEDYYYYMKYEDEKYRIYKFNLVTNENELIKELDEYKSFYINCENIVLSDYDNIKIKDKMEYPKYHTVTFKYGDEIQEIQRVEDGKTAVAPTSNIYKEGLSFIKWDENVNKQITEDTTINAVYSVNQINVTFKDFDGNILETQTVDAGSDVTCSINPTRQDYVFIGWKLPTDYYVNNDILKNVTKDITVEAVYEPIFSYNILNNEEIVIYGVSEDSLVSDKVDIPENYMGYKVTEVCFYDLSDKISEIIIPESVNYIYLYNCDNLKSVNIKGSSIIYVTIENCPNLVITIQKGSLAEEFVKQTGCKYVVIDNNDSTEDINNPTDEDINNKPADQDANNKPTDEDTNNNPGDQDDNNKTDEKDTNNENKEPSDINNDQVNSGSDNKPNTGDNSKALALIGIMAISFSLVVRKKIS